MNTSINNLKQLTNSLAVSGYEWELGIADTIQTIVGFPGKRIGNNLVYQIGSGKKVICISAHMDEVGFFMTNVNKNSAQIVPVGDIDITDVANQTLNFSINNKIIECTIGNVSNWNDAIIKNSNQGYIGAVGTFKKTFTVKNDQIYAPSLDNKTGCLALITLLRNFKKSDDKTIYFCFSAKEEIGVNGVMNLIRIIEPSICIDVDSAYARTDTSDLPTFWNVPEIGKGPSLQLMGNEYILSDRFRRIVESYAQKVGISLQYEIPDSESGDTNAKSLSNAGYETIQINIPVANQHTSVSTASINDISDTSILLNALISSEL